MTIADTSLPGARVRFGVFARLREVFALVFRRRPGIFIGFSLLLFLGLPMALGAAAIGVLEFSDPEQALSNTNTEGTIAAIGGFLALVIWLVGAGVLTLAGCDEMAGQRRSLGTYFRQTIRRLHVIFILGLLASLAVMAGFFLIGFVGLWAAAVYSVFMPALLWEGAGWGALGRSRRLTKEYRWPIMGLIFLIYLAFIALFVLVSLTIGTVPEENETAFIIASLIPIVLQVLFIPIFCALPPVVHARLRSLKEGDSSAELRSVFE
ncbi:hypothetical protein [Mangrovicella endophytica]|uniref:hypothetical protein n=1 Tax=Mangrovicella endophytica TaxID=2066697 RepID=UPI000C9E5C9F|nr:hypothetical protein [Mangrovicella endophytica]